MASAASSSAPLLHHDAFIGFRGKDTRNSFTDHLFKALVRAGVRTFRDDKIDRGEELKPEIKKAIMESRASIVVLSKNYADSRWCLDELHLILEQRRSSNHFVLPVFYNVDPSDVRNQRQSFAVEVEYGVEGSKWTEDNVNRWKVALTEVANLTGMEALGSETDFIAKVVDTVICKLDLKLVSTPAHLVGMDTRAEFINSWLKNEQSGANVLAICGMGGSGKTTLAQFIYNANKQNFESSSFLREIGKHYKQPQGLLGLQNLLLTDILGRKHEWIYNESEGTKKVEDALQVNRVLIVLDDIDEHDDLGALLGTKMFHTESKIIMTTTRLDIQAWFGSVSWRCQVHQLRLLNDHESLELLSWHAFKSKVPMEGFKELSIQLSQYCSGNPLARQVLGASLFVNAEEPWKRTSMIEVWRSTLSLMNSLKGNLDDRIQRILQKSFDSLPLTINKELFLHIAFFFIGEYEDYVVTILEHDWNAKAGINTLVNRCLLTISPSKKLMMHQLLQEMGRNIVLQGNQDPAKRSRVSQNDESYRLLTKGEGSDGIEGLALDMQKINRGITPDPLVPKTGSFAKMDRLKLLRLENVKLKGSYKNFPELRWLCWHGSPFKKIPFGLLMSSLIAIDMSYGNLKKFESPMGLNSLKILNLKGSRELVSICNLYRLGNLKSLILWNCSSLTHVCESIGGLKSLALLDFTGCNNLGKVSLNKKYANYLQTIKALCICGETPQQCLFSLPVSLKFFFLNYCNLENDNDLPVVISGQPIFYLNLGNNPFEVLPNNIPLRMLRVLELTSCVKLKCLLCLPSTLEELYINFCYSLEKITFESARFTLREFVYGGCIKLCEIQGLFKLVSIAKLDEADFGHLKWIKAFEGCKVNLVGDEITKNRNKRIQVLYEYGIMSTYLPDIKDQIMATPDYMSSSPFLSFCVPSCPKKRSIQGLNVTSLYRPSGEDEDMWVLFIKISNTTKGLTWMYNPVVYCRPEVGEDAVWISNWPIGNILDTGDEVNVSIIVGNELMVSRCSASLVYMDDGEVELEYCKNYTKEEEVIGGDLSEFKLSTGGYYLCRRDFFKSATPDWLEVLLGDSIHCKELRGWGKSRQTQHLNASFVELETFRGYILSHMKRVVVKVDLHDDKEKRKALKALSSLSGIFTLAVDMKDHKFTVIGDVDPVDVVGKLKKSWHTEIVSVGPAKEERRPTANKRRRKKEEHEAIKSWWKLTGLTIPQ